MSMTSKALGSVFLVSLVALGCSGGANTGSGGTGGGGSTESTNPTQGNGSTVAAGTGTLTAAASTTGSAQTGGTASSGTASTGSGQGGSGPAIQTVFLIMMENHSWTDIAGNSSAPYINGTLVPAAARAAAYSTPPGNHPSEPNYIWLESGSNLTVTSDSDPSSNHQGTTEHITTELEAAGISWKAYAEGISGTDCPQGDTGLFVVRHTPQLFFDDVTDSGSTTSAHCIQHVRPYTELETDLNANTVARYNFITPDLCHDMHGQPFGVTCLSILSDLVHEGDTWLSTEIPKITSSAAYQNGGVIFIVWDEGTETLEGSASDGPLPFFVLSKFAKPGYTGNVTYTHSSTVRTVQEIFGLTPFMRDAANATDLSDLFTTFP